ncbi:MAG: hypothetical protein AB7T07_06670 [Steroidobacteraceae bacterium]
MKRLFPILSILWISLLAACSKLDMPEPGTYRACVKLRGGEAPFQLQISEQHGSTLIGILHDGELQPATHLTVQDGQLTAQLPDAAGTLHARIGRGILTGEVRITDPQGQSQTLPFTAERDRHDRFVAEASTDNADVTGYWLLDAPGSFPAPVTLQMNQHFDAVDGQLHLPDGSTAFLLGQTHNDTVYLSALGQGRAMLFKGSVNEHGELQGELWVNLSNAIPAVARRMTDEQAAALQDSEEQVRKVALPWNIPMR